MIRILILFILFVSVNVNANAQSMSVQSAWNYYKYDELDRAKVEIDKAAVHEKTMASPKTWYYRGLIYIKMYKHEKFGGLDPLALEKATESFKKCLELDPKYENRGEIELELARLADSFESRGVDQYSANDFSNALNSFEMSSSLNARDTNIFFNCAISAERSGNTPKALGYCDKLIELGYKRGWAFSTKSKILLASKDTIGSLETIKKARQLYPNDQELVISELNIYLMSSRTKEAREIIDVAIEKDPKNHQLYQVKGDMLSNSGDREGAITQYKKVVELNPSYPDAYFNLGAVYSIMGNDFIAKANNLPPSKQKEYDGLKKQADAKFSEALPYLEKAHELDPKNVGTMETLSQIYVRLNMLEKASAIRKKMSELK